MSRKTTRLVIGDDHRLLAEACAKMLRPEFDVVGIFSDGRTLVQAAIELKPDVAIMDISMPHLNGLSAADQIKRALPSLKLVFLTMNSDVEVAAEAFRRGASGYVLKHSGAEDLLNAVRTVVRGQSYLSPLLARETLDYLLRGPGQNEKGSEITARQAEILQLLAEGQAMKQVASVLDITLGTVAFHKYQMMRRLGITTNAGLYAYAMKQHLIPECNQAG
jgi:DNA-binding NarL/FixJ family response regulator